MPFAYFYLVHYITKECKNLDFYGTFTNKEPNAVLAISSYSLSDYKIRILGTHKFYLTYSTTRKEFSAYLRVTAL